MAFLGVQAYACIGLRLVFHADKGRSDVLPNVIINVDELTVQIVVVTLGHVAQVATILPVSVIVRVLCKEKAAEEDELARVHGLLVDHGLHRLEEVVVVTSEWALVERDAVRRCHRLVNVETIRVCYFHIVLMRQQLLDFPDLLHLLEGSTSRTMRILHRTEDKQEVVVLLLDEAVEEFTSRFQVRGQLKQFHVTFPLLEPLFDRLDLLQQLHLCPLFFGDSSGDFQGKLVAMWALHGVRLVSIHWIIRRCVLQILV